MTTYTFNNLIKDILQGREIEFVYNSNQYSITGYSDNYIILYNDSQKCEMSRLKRTLSELENLRLIVIEDMQLEVIFDNLLYKIDSLYIL